MSWSVETYHQDHLARRARLFGTPPMSVAAPPKAPAPPCLPSHEATPAPREPISLPGPPRARAILIAIAEEFDLDPRDIIGRSHKANFAAARWHLYRRLAELGWGLSAIGRYCGRNHTTVRHALLKQGVDFPHKAPRRDDIRPLTDLAVKRMAIRVAIYDLVRDGGWHSKDELLNAVSGISTGAPKYAAALYTSVHSLAGSLKMSAEFRPRFGIRLVGVPA